MQTIYFWRHTDPRTGRRQRTRYRLGEAEARQRLIEPERIEESAMTVAPVAVTPSGHWRSGLAMNEDGAMVRSLPCPGVRELPPGDEPGPAA
jgi:hypothetical protein